MKILIIGGCGFLGSHLADELFRRGHKIVLFDKKKTKKINRKYKTIIGDIQNLSSLKKAIKDSEIVYHYAGIADIGEALENPINTVKTNILGTVNILELCKKYKVKRFIFASSIYVHSSQGGFYRTSKQSSELYVEEYSKRHSLDYTILRYGTVYGPRADIRNNLSKIIFDGVNTGIVRYRGTSKAVRRFIHVRDAAKASANILKKKFINKNILVTGNRSKKIKDLLHLIAKLLKISTKPKFENSTQQGHYNINPYSYKPKSDKRYFMKSSIKLEAGISELINEIRNEKK